MVRTRMKRGGQAGAFVYVIAMLACILTTCIGAQDRTAVVRPRCVNVAVAHAERRHDIDVTSSLPNKCVLTCIAMKASLKF